MNFEVDSGTGPAGTIPVVHHYTKKSKSTHLYRIYRLLLKSVFKHVKYRFKIKKLFNFVFFSAVNFQLPVCNV